MEAVDVESCIKSAEYAETAQKRTTIQNKNLEKQTTNEGESRAFVQNKALVT